MGEQRKSNTCGTEIALSKIFLKKFSMNQKLKMGKKKGKKANNSVTEEKAVENVEPTNNVEPSITENGVKVKKSKKNKKSLNESNFQDEPKEVSVQSPENGNKSKKSRKNKKVDKEKESEDSSPMEVQTPESVPKVNLVKQKLKQSLIAENAYI